MAEQIQRVLVVGAGIGGVAAAAALARSGRSVVVLERRAELGEVGAGISIWPRAMSVLDTLGVAEGLRGRLLVAGSPAGLRRPDGRWVLAMDSSRAPMPTMVHRAALHHAMVAAVPASVEIRAGVEVVGVDQDGGGVSVTTAAGDTVEADLLVGADGLRSAVRRAVVPNAVEPRYSGYTAYRGVSDLRVGAGSETWGRGLRFGVAPLIDGRTYWFAVANAPAGGRSRDSGAERTADLLRRFGGWHDPVPALLSATDPEGVLANDVFDLPPPLPPFVTGRTVLIGDAAHAMTPNLGRGACAAIEDAGSLAASLSEHEDVAAALSAHEARRRPDTTRLVRRAHLVGRLGQTEGRIALALRGGAFAAVGLASSLVRRGTSARR